MPNDSNNLNNINREIINKYSNYSKQSSNEPGKNTLQKLIEIQQKSKNKSSKEGGE